ncbi:Maleylacetoacetate isomerase [Aspergillus sclerotialis]|uniref:Maleylacetoacetate isomerase n=1 Tax=Aspergillus sclerotialis TaxID=2070753 RepID=A0A3A2ZID6_9EURO|nr:Maleylacetoacetate isomerase [Aspergillus sclerotialis]
MSDTPKITLYTYFRSSCSARLRIALNLKSLPYTSVYRSRLVVEYPNKSPVTITQSLSALEYLDEIPSGNSHKLLPPTSDPEIRALVRTLSQIIACDVQPVTNLRILKEVDKLGADRATWSRDLIEKGFGAFESIVKNTAGRFSVGDVITMADVCLVPAAWGAERVGVELGKFPTIKKIVDALEQEEAVKKGHWKNQEDTPQELRG